MVLLELVEEIMKILLVFETIIKKKANEVCCHLINSNQELALHVHVQTLGVMFLICILCFDRFFVLVAVDFFT